MVPETSDRLTQKAALLGADSDAIEALFDVADASYKFRNCDSYDPCGLFQEGLEAGTKIAEVCVERGAAGYSSVRLWAVPLDPDVQGTAYFVGTEDEVAAKIEKVVVQYQEAVLGDEE